MIEVSRQGEINTVTVDESNTHYRNNAGHMMCKRKICKSAMIIIYDIENQLTGAAACFKLRYNDK